MHVHFTRFNGQPNLCLQASVREIAILMLFHWCLRKKTCRVIYWKWNTNTCTFQSNSFNNNQDYYNQREPDETQEEREWKNPGKNMEDYQMKLKKNEKEQTRIY